MAMGAKKAAGSRSPSKSNKSPTKNTTQTSTQSSAQTAQAAQPATTQETPAAAGSQPAPTPPAPKPFIFKGYPQPPVDERLFAAKNFLADEDLNRCLEFDKKIAQVEEFIAQVEKDNVPCDAELFRDVKIKLKVHRDWEEQKKISPFDTGCCDAPLIPPFSTRLVNPETAARFQREREAQGLVTQMRGDHAPFTVNPEEDHSAFLAKLRDDSSTDPDAIDQDTNLLWTESRAYLWAIRDPALIPYLMHPTQGIPTKGTRADDTRNRSQVPVSETVRGRPARGWIPAHITATEDKINEWLKAEDISEDNFMKLEELLCPFEPLYLHDLHQQHASFEEAAALGDLSAHQKAMAAQISSRFSKAQSDWLNSLAVSGVCLVVRTPGEPEVQLPGVFYVDDGIMTPAHVETLAKAQGLLDRALGSGRMDLTEEEIASLDSLMQHSLPDDIREVQRRRIRILEIAGANSVSDLDEADQAEVIKLEEEEQELKSKWEEDLKRAGGAEFWYLRPAEMERNQRNILYLPWTLTVIPTVPVQVRSDLQLCPEAQNLQDEVNKDLPRNTDFPNIETGALPFRRLLSQVVYPGLRDLITPYFALREKEAHSGLNFNEQAQAQILAEAVFPLWDAWWRGLGDRITVKMPFPEQQNKIPGVLYCRSPNKHPHEDLETYFTRKATAINQVLSKYASVPSGEEPEQYWLQLRDLCEDLQYPALRKLWELNESGMHKDEAEAASLRESYSNSFQHWMQSKKGHSIRIKKPNPRIDPDDDPSVVYYRGALLTPLSPDFQGMPESIKDSIRANQAQSLPLFPPDIRPLLAPLLQRLLEAHEKSSTPASKVILDWHLNAFLNVEPPVDSKFNCFMTAQPLAYAHTPSVSPTSDRSTSISQSSATSAESGNGFGNGNGNWGNCQGNGIENEENHALFGVDLTVLLPEIRVVESEINRILGLLRDHNNQPRLHRRSLDDYDRLRTLLQQFWPNRVFRIWERAERYNNQFASRQYLTEREREEHSVTVEQFKNDLSIAETQWIRSLVATGVHVQISPEEALPLDRITLIFNPGKSLQSNEASPERVFTLLMPEAANSPDVHISQLTYRRIDNSTPPNTITVNYTPKKRAYILGLEKKINVLLQKWRTSTLTWDESDLLLGQPRAVMSPYLAELDTQLREVDKKARQELLTGDTLVNWIQMWDAWQKLYESWLHPLPPTGIRIAKGDQNDNQPGVLRLQLEDHQSLPPISRLRNLPLSFQKLQDLINGVIMAPDHLSGEDMEWFDTALAHPFRPVLDVFRRMITGHVLEKICPKSLRDPEDKALVEAIVSLGQTLLKERLFMSKTTGGVQLVEPVPGEVIYSGVGSSGTDLFPTTNEGVMAIAQKLYDQLCPPYLDPAKIGFHDTALHLRMNMPLKEDEIDFLIQDIPESAEMQTSTLMEKVVEFLKQIQLQGEDIAKTQQDVANAVESVFWRRLMLDPDMEKKIMATLDNPVLPHRLELLPRRLREASPQSPAPPPNEDEVKELEIEINNLLTGERNKALNNEQEQKLNYLLRSFLPPRLRFLKNQIDRFDGQYLANGLDVRDSLALSEAKDQFPHQFEEWKRRISALGIILDPWYSTLEAIAEACSRARRWKEYTTDSDGSTISGIISSQIQDPIVRQWHDIYAVLRRYVEEGCQNTADVEDELLLRFIPHEITNHINQIKKQVNTVQPSPGIKSDSTTMLLNTMKDQLIKSYMKWLVSLTPMQFRRFRDQARSRELYTGEINFTSKAERRGIQRAAIELALNVLATNQEQHRPNDRFRTVNLPLPIQSPEKEVPLCLPLREEDRPIEQDPFEYSRKLLEFRQWKDFDYGLARLRTNNNRGGFLPAPNNYKGPVAIATTNDFHEAVRQQLNNLGSIQAGLINAVTSAPRPLLEQLLLLVDAGLRYDTEQHLLADNVALTEDGLDLLADISGESWDEERCEYGHEIPGIDTADERSRLEEFEIDIAGLTEIPLWRPAPDFDMTEEESDPNELFMQIEHDPAVTSTGGMTGDEVRQATGNRRMARTDGIAGTPHLWDLNSVTRYLRAMASAGRIHLDDLPNGDVRVSRIPISGHPENKYVTSRADAPFSPGVRTDEGGKLEVQYDAAGNFGPPIVQPNKFHYLQRLAFRLGRDIKINAKVLAAPDPEIDDRVNGQLSAGAAAEAEMEIITPGDRFEDPTADRPPPRTLTLQRMAQDLHKSAPDIAQEVGFEINAPSEITEQQAAVLLQMQILEEASNNWEFKFPEKEHVWDFASSRLEKATRTINGRTIRVQPRLTQYFHMRRFPPCCQSTITKTAIKESGPTVQEKPQPAVETPAAATRGPPKKSARHIKGHEPYFTLGESAYEKAFLSWRMEQELKDVPEFQVKKPRRSWFWNFRTRKDDDYDDKIDRYPLPKIPATWVPDSVSIADKRAQVLELAKKTPAFPNPEILEYYHTPREIEQIKLQREWDEYASKRKVADAKVEKYTGKKFESLTNEELCAAHAALGINQTTGIFDDDE